MSQYSGLIVMVVILVLFYLILFVPENKKRKKYNQMINDLKINDEIVTRGGIIGRIISINGNSVVLQTGPDRVRIKLDKNGISGMINEDAGNKKDDKKVEKKTEKKEIDAEQK